MILVALALVEPELELGAVSEAEVEGGDTSRVAWYRRAPPRLVWDTCEKRAFLREAKRSACIF